MKKLLLIVSLIIFLAGCASDGIDDSFSAYRHKSAATLYHDSIKQLQKKNYEDAAATLEALNGLYPFGQYAQQGLVNLMYAYYKDNELEESLAVADRYIALYPRGKYSPYIYYMRGVINSNRGYTWLQRKFGVNQATRDTTNLKRAFLAFNQLIRIYPDSKYVHDAKLRMQYIRNLLAEKEVGIANFYFERKAYVAAVNRATNVVEHFDKTPSVIKALNILVKSYRALGLHKDANNTLRIFQASYPSSPLLKQLLSSHA